jgi:AAA domain
MSFQIKDSLEVQFSKAPAIAIAGPSGSGKTESAMRLARGYCGTDKFLVIDTEEKRALYKKSRHQPWDWMDFQPPFSPENYVDALEAGKGYRAVILDSGSHEYAGPGGLQDIQMATLERMAKGNEARMEALTAPSWKDAKQRHKSKLMSYLIRYPVLLIVCLRAEPKVKFVKVMKDGRERTEIVDAGYVPICEKMFMYEMLVGCMMMPDNAGVPVHIKRLEQDLEPVFIAGKQVDEGTGARLAAWAADRKKTSPEPTPKRESAPKEEPASASMPNDIDTIIKSLDVNSLAELASVFEGAWKRTKGNAQARARVKEAYDKKKTALENPQKIETSAEDVA